MFVHSFYLEQTGTIIYEKDQQLVSGLVNYSTPDYTIEVDCRFSMIDRKKYITKSDETHRAKHDKLLTQFGATEIRRLNSSGVYIKEGRTRLQWNGDEYRAVDIDDFGQGINISYLPMGVVQVIFDRRTPIAN